MQRMTEVQCWISKTFHMRFGIPYELGWKVQVCRASELSWISVENLLLVQTLTELKSGGWERKKSWPTQTSPKQNEQKRHCWTELEVSRNTNLKSYEKIDACNRSCTIVIFWHCGIMCTPGHNLFSFYCANIWKRLCTYCIFLSGLKKTSKT